MALWFKTTSDRLVNLDEFERFEVELFEETVMDKGQGLVMKVGWCVLGCYRAGDVRIPEKILGPYRTREEAVKEGFDCLLFHLNNGGITIRG